MKNINYLFTAITSIDIVKLAEIAFLIFDLFLVYLLYEGSRLQCVQTRNSTAHVT